MQHRDATMAHDISGNGPWLTLVHGFSQHRGVWSAQRETFAQRFRLLSVDLRGHGESSAPESGYGPVEYAGDLLALLDGLGVACTHLWGTHTGAAVGLYLAALHPERIASLVLDGAVIPGVPLEDVERHMALAREVAARDGLAAAREMWFESGAFFAGVRRDADAGRVAEHRTMIAEFSGAPWLASGPSLPVPDIASLLPTVRQPVLLMNGSDDLPAFLATAERLEQELPGARRYVIPGAGAFPLWEAPEAVNPVVLGFLEEID